MRSIFVADEAPEFESGLVVTVSMESEDRGEEHDQIALRSLLGEKNAASPSSECREKIAILSTSSLCKFCLSDPIEELVVFVWQVVASDRQHRIFERVEVPEEMLSMESSEKLVSLGAGEMIDGVDRLGQTLDIDIFRVLFWGDHQIGRFPT
jgi:hypothetical protein